MAAILSLDVVGYSAMMAEDAKSTLTELNRVLNEKVRPAVADEGGRIFKLMGVGSLL